MSSEFNKDKTEQDYERQHLADQAATVLIIQGLFFKAVNKIFIRVWPFIPKTTETPYIVNYTGTLVGKIIEAEVTRLLTDIHYTIRERSTKAWKLSNKKNDALVNALFERAGRGIPPQLKEKLFPSNLPALESFLNRSEGGMKLSKRIWKYKGQVLQEIEAGIQVGIAEGKSAAAMATEMKRHLNDPGQLFRRVRDKYGKLQLSRAAQAYHPGRGKYRSSYQNALRMTSTEINMAYRMADHERWKKNPAILGFEVKTSGNHPVRDLCDDLAGKYPKNFVFRQWHVRCRCFAVPIRPGEKDFNSYLDSILAGEDYQFTGHVEGAPHFTQWVNDNRAKLTRWKSKPFFLTDNTEFSGFK